jgi:hypothetical protein
MRTNSGESAAIVRMGAAPDWYCAEVCIGVTSDRISQSLSTSRPSRSWNGDSTQWPHRCVCVGLQTGDETSFGISLR